MPTPGLLSIAGLLILLLVVPAAGAADVAFVSPRDGELVAGDLQFKLRVREGADIARIDVYVAGTLAGSAVPPDWSFAWSAPALVGASIVAIAFDASGRPGERVRIKTAEHVVTEWVDVNAVQLYPVVTDRGGRYVRGLARDVVHRSRSGQAGADRLLLGGPRAPEPRHRARHQPQHDRQAELRHRGRLGADPAARERRRRFPVCVQPRSHGRPARRRRRHRCAGAVRSRAGARRRHRPLRRAVGGAARSRPRYGPQGDHPVLGRPGRTEPAHAGAGGEQRSPERGAPLHRRRGNLGARRRGARRPRAVGARDRRSGALLRQLPQARQRVRVGAARPALAVLVELHAAGGRERSAGDRGQGRWAGYRVRCRPSYVYKRR